MSCHDIGHGLNSVTEVVMEMYMNDKITKDVASRLFHALRAGVHWCDGNEYEATESLEGILCGRCLKVFEEGDDVVGILDAINQLTYKVHLGKDSDSEYVQKYEKLFREVCDKKDTTDIGYELKESIWNKTVSSVVCEDCFLELMREFAKPEEGEKHG